MRRLLSVAGLALVLGACASNQVRTPLPLDLGAPPRATTGFGGTWVGRWGQTLDHTLVVQRIEGSQADFIYSWGANPAAGIAPGFTRHTGTINGDMMRFTSPNNGAEVIYKLVDADTLIGQYTLRGTTTPGRFTRLK
jgi:hypothetical protein